MAAHDCDARDPNRGAYGKVGMVMRDWWKVTDTPDEVQAVPWMHPAAVAYLESLVQPDWTVLEQGSGGSTLWFAKRVKHVVSVEDNPVWYECIRIKAPVNVEMCRGINYPPILPVDLVYIDGRPNTARIGWIVVADKLARPGGIVVLDNSDDVAYAAEKAELERKASGWMVVHSNVPLQFNDTTFYRLPGGKAMYI